MTKRMLKRFGLRLLRFLRSHHPFIEAMILALIAAFLVSKVPLIGNFLGMCALALGVIIGLLGELKASLRS